MIKIEVDGERIEFDSFYSEPSFGDCGSIWGMDETTKAGDQFRNFVPNKCLWALAAYKQNLDGSYFGIDGLFAKGEWGEDENGDILYKVWERIA